MTSKKALHTIAFNTQMVGMNFGDELRCIEKDLKRLETLERYLVKWLELLQTDGINSKSMVINDIQFLLKEQDNE